MGRLARTGAVYGLKPRRSGAWWLGAAKQATVHDPTQKTTVKTTAIRLLMRLPLQRLPDREAALGPPVPAHVLATLAHLQLEKLQAQIVNLEAENASLRLELSSGPNHQRGRVMDFNEITH